MNYATVFMISAGLLVAWVIGPLVVLDYRRKIVPLRYAEILDRFSATNPGETLESKEDRSKSGAWHYARLLNPSSEPNNPEQAIDQQFGRFQGWDRYWLPLALVIILSGLMLTFSGLWLVECLPPVASSPGGELPSVPAGQVNSSRITLPVASATATITDSGATDGTKAAAPDTSILKRVPVPFVMALWGAYGMPCTLDLCEFFAGHCWDVATNTYKPNWPTDPAVVKLANRLNIPEEFLVMQMLRSLFEDPNTKFLIRVWFGPAHTTDRM